MAYHYEEIGSDCVATFACDDNLKVGDPCYIASSDTVGGCAEGDLFCGVVRSIHNGRAAVALSGFVTLNYSGTAPLLGYCNLCANGTGGVMVDADGREHLVIHTDSTAKTVCFLL